MRITSCAYGAAGMPTSAFSPADATRRPGMA
ncbi:hypothetical protein ABID76_006584 [Burkholderia ambifaria]